jgi:hypothetical protein
LIKAYPIPLETSLNVQLPETDLGTVEVTIQDARTGQLITQQTVKMAPDTDLKVDVSNVRGSGIYIMTLIMPDGQVIRKPLIK